MRTVQQIAASVADDICMFGHYKGSGAVFTSWDATSPCCLFLNPTFSVEADSNNGEWRLKDSIELASEGDAFTDALKAATGKLTRGQLIAWSDMAPTEEVVSKLRELAAS